MTQSSDMPSSWQSITIKQPGVHAILQQVAEAIYTEINDAVSVNPQQEIQIEQAIALDFLKRQEDKVVFAESVLRADYLLKYATNGLISTWDDIGTFLDTVDHLCRVSILLGYDRALGAQSLCNLAHEHGKDLISRVNEAAILRSTEAVSHEHFWHLYDSFCAALSDLRPEPKPLADALEIIESVNPNAGKVQYEMQGLLMQSQEIVEAFYQEFISRSNPLFIEFIFTTLLILSQFDREHVRFASLSVH